MFSDNVQNAVPHRCLLGIADVGGIDADGVQRDIDFCRISAYPAHQLGAFRHGHCLINFDIHRADAELFAIVVEGQAEYVLNFRLRGNKILDLAVELGGTFCAKEFVDALAYHVHAGFDDEAGDDDAHPRFHIDMGKVMDGNTGKNANGNNGIPDGLCAAHDQGGRPDSFSFLSGKAAVHHLCEHGNDHENNDFHIVMRCR